MPWNFCLQELSVSAMKMVTLVMTFLNVLVCAREDSDP